MSVPGVTVASVDTSVILYAAELEAPTLRETARRFPEDEAARLGVSLDPADVLLRQAQGGTEMHVVAAHELVAHLAATGRIRSARTARLWSWRVPGRWC